MSDRTQWIVLLGDFTLSIARLVGGQFENSDGQSYVRDREAPADTAQRVHRLLEEWHYGGKPVMLALGSSWCTSATISVPSPRQTRKRGAVGFLVEPHLPWPVEEAVVDYELVETNRVFAVSTEAQPLAALVAALEEHGITVASIAPLARLALEHHLQMAAAIGPKYALLWRNEQTVDLWLVANNRPVLWNWLPYELSAVSRAFKHLALSEDVALRVAGRQVPVEFLKASVAEAGLESVDVPPLESQDPIIVATREAAAVLQGKRPAAIELRRDQLAARDRNRAIRPHLRLLQGAALLLLAVLGMALFNQTRQTDLARHNYDRRQTVLYQRLFPKEHVPVAMHARLQSELVRLKGVRGERSDLPQAIPFLTVLEPLLRTLPADLRYRLLEVRIEHGQLYLVGQVRAHGDADRIAEALRSAGLEVSSPNTNRLEKEGVEFRISAHLVRTAGKHGAKSL